MMVHHESLELRNFEIVETIQCLQDWKVEVRKRLSGKLQGNLYKVFISPNDCKFYSLAKAIVAGFNPEGFKDGRTKSEKAKKRKA